MTEPMTGFWGRINWPRFDVAAVSYEFPAELPEEDEPEEEEAEECPQ